MVQQIDLDSCIRVNTANLYYTKTKGMFITVLKCTLTSVPVCFCKRVCFYNNYIAHVFCFIFYPFYNYTFDYFIILNVLITSIIFVVLKLFKI